MQFKIKLFFFNKTVGNHIIIIYHYVISLITFVHFNVYK